jgi:hypothetical protein
MSGNTENLPVKILKVGFEKTAPDSRPILSHKYNFCSAFFWYLIPSKLIEKKEKLIFIKLFAEKKHVNLTKTYFVEFSLN